MSGHRARSRFGRAGPSFVRGAGTSFGLTGSACTPVVVSPSIAAVILYQDLHQGAVPSLEAAPSFYSDLTAGPRLPLFLHESRQHWRTVTKWEPAHCPEVVSAPRSCIGQPNTKGTVAATVLREVAGREPFSRRRLLSNGSWSHGPYQPRIMDMLCWIGSRPTSATSFSHRPAPQRNRAMHGGADDLGFGGRL